jgi:hypothetical protein
MKERQAFVSTLRIRTSLVAIVETRDPTCWPIRCEGYSVRGRFDPFSISAGKPPGTDRLVSGDALRRSSVRSAFELFDLL